MTTLLGVVISESWSPKVCVRGIEISQMGPVEKVCPRALREQGPNALDGTQKGSYAPWLPRSFTLGLPARSVTLITQTVTESIHIDYKDLCIFGPRSSLLMCRRIP